jgi:hypothetical protein
LFLQGGKFIFLEHVADSGNIIMYLLQLLLQYFFAYLHGNCCITRHTESHIRRAKFSSLEIDKFFADEMMKPTPLIPEIGLIRLQIAGVATK